MTQKIKLKKLKNKKGKGKTMAYYQADVVAKIKKIDLLTFLKESNPKELKYKGNGNYETVTHDSLKISNGMWYWFSRGIGGKNALEYLIQVQGKTFLEAMEILTNGRYEVNKAAEKIKKEEIKLKVPLRNENEDIAKNYLIKRGIDEAIIEQCIDNGYIYQEKNTDNVVFVGYDQTNTEKYISVRGTKGARYFKEARGSNKAYSFSLNSDCKASELHLFESAIDVLSYATILKLYNKNWEEYNLLSLAGIYKPANNIEESKVPVALDLYLKNNKIDKIILHLDNDEAGRLSTNAIKNKLKDEYEIIDSPAKVGKDINDFLLYLRQKNKNIEKER